MKPSTQISPPHHLGKTCSVTNPMAILYQETRGRICRKTKACTTYSRLHRKCGAGHLELQLLHTPLLEDGRAKHYQLSFRWYRASIDPLDREVCICQPSTQKLPPWPTWASCYWKPASVADEKSFFTVRGPRDRLKEAVVVIRFYLFDHYQTA